MTAQAIGGLEAPARGLLAITPNDSTDISAQIRAINVAESGTVKLTMLDGSEGTIFVAAGSVFPVRARRIWATGTTATGIVGLI